MPLLGDRGAKKIILKKATEIAKEEVWVKISQVIFPEDLDYEDNEDEKQASYVFFSRAITEWNFNLADGSIAPITVENIKKVPAVDLVALENDMNIDKQLSEVKKKISSSTSQEEKIK